MDAGVDPAALAAYLRKKGLSDARSLDATLISGGRSNLTYLLHVNEAEWVLRRPPLGEVLATAHDMSREHRVMSALAHSAVPVPPMVALCEDPAVLGAPFFIMERVPGEALRQLAAVENLTESQRADLVTERTAVLASLHEVDPDQVGLNTFGRPDGFMARQVRRWTIQLRATLEPTAAMLKLAGNLATSVPMSSLAAIVHGDYRLDNCLCLDAKITAVLDWEMSTLGDPLSDLALFGVYYDGLADLPNAVVQAPGRLPGCPSMGTCSIASRSPLGQTSSTSGGTKGSPGSSSPSSWPGWTTGPSKGRPLGRSSPVRGSSSNPASSAAWCRWAELSDGA